MEHLVTARRAPEEVHIVLERPDNDDERVHYHPEGCLAALLHQVHLHCLRTSDIERLGHGRSQSGHEENSVRVAPTPSPDPVQSRRVSVEVSGAGGHSPSENSGARSMGRDLRAAGGQNPEPEVDG